MTTQEVKRKLTAILSADVKGYSRLMGEDEEATVRTLNAYKEVMTNLIQQYHGRVVDAPGDNVLAEFTSVVDAVRCAVEIQKELIHSVIINCAQNGLVISWWHEATDDTRCRNRCSWAAG